VGDVVGGIADNSYVIYAKIQKLNQLKTPF
jgi:hypothetical protein